MDPLTPQDPYSIGPYRLLSRLGAGGMGRVYLARSEGGRTVAVKVVQDEFAQNPEFRRRFALEVAAARRVGGRWTAPVLDADTDAATPWVATGYVPGPDLHSVVARDHGPLPERSVRALANGLAHALQTIHGAALIHRDLKPSNVLLTIDGPRVIDFGIARALDSVADGIRTSTGAVIGSPGFMSPEQVRGQRLTPASDVFCLGSVLAYAATGRMPFGTADSGLHAVMFRIAEEEPDLTGVPAGVVELVRACLAKAPEQRPSVAALLEWTPDAEIRPGVPWLPGPLLAQLGSHAARLLDADAPAHADAYARTRTPEPAPTQAPGTPPPVHIAPTQGAAQHTGGTRRRSARVAVYAAMAAVILAAGGFAAMTQLGDELGGEPGSGDGNKTTGSGGGGSGSGSGSGPTEPAAGNFGGTWEGLVQRTDSSVSDEHEFLRIRVDGRGGPGMKAAAFTYLTKDAYCKVDATFGAKRGNTMTLTSYKVVKQVRHKDSTSSCNLSRSKALTLSGGELRWSMGDRTAELKRTPPKRQPIHAKFLGTWKSETQGTLTIKQGPAGTRVAKYTGWSIDYRCNGSAELVSATKNTVTLSPLELAPTTPKNIGCPHSVPETITWKSADELELRYPESISVRLTRAG
ncbi:serine/threonine protein kinase [Streptomyces sp. NPDC002851]